MNISVHKFGGASVKDAPSLKNVAGIIQQLEKPTLVVVSAIGKTTNALEQVVNAVYFKKHNPSEHLLPIKQFHHHFIHQLFDEHSSERAHQLIADIQKYWQYAEQLINQPTIYSYGQLYDQVVSLGELISSTIVSEYLNFTGTYNTWADIRKILITDHQWRAANVDINLSYQKFNELIQPLLNNASLIVTQGFIGSTANGFTTTLGREGSDYTAALLAYFTDAQSLTIWKDVEGILNADPRYFTNTQKIDELSYYDAIEMTYYGATVIHPKTIKPLQNKNIPLQVKSFLNPNTTGTLIHQPKEYKKITTFSFLPNQILISLQSGDFSFFTETHIQQAFQIINDFHIKINLMQNTALNFSFCISYDPITTPPFIQELQKHFKVLYNEQVGILTIRHYLPNILSSLLHNKEILLEQRTRHHVQFVIKET